MSIINRIYGDFILSKHSEEIEDFKEVVISVIAEEIVIHHNKLIKEVMDTNLISTVSAIKNKILKLEKLRDDVIENPLIVNVEELEKLNNTYVNDALVNLEIKLKGGK